MEVEENKPRDPRRLGPLQQSAVKGLKLFDEFDVWEALERFVSG